MYKRNGANPECLLVPAPGNVRIALTLLVVSHGAVSAVLIRSQRTRPLLLLGYRPFTGMKRGSGGTKALTSSSGRLSFWNRLRKNCSWKTFVLWDQGKHASSDFLRAGHALIRHSVSLSAMCSCDDDISLVSAFSSTRSMRSADCPETRSPSMISLPVAPSLLRKVF